MACQQLNTGFAGIHGSTIGVAMGSLSSSLGLRNAMTNSYMGFVPAFEFVMLDGATEVRGGHFWDGRADTLELQALGPLLNPLEINNPNQQSVLKKIASASYAEQFKAAFGANIFSTPDTAFEKIGVANDLPAKYLGNIEIIKAPFNRNQSDGPS